MRFRLWAIWRRVVWVARHAPMCPIGAGLWVAGVADVDCPVRGRCVRHDHGGYDACYVHPLTGRAVRDVVNR
jgi:hypothetical protein